MLLNWKYCSPTGDAEQQKPQRSAWRAATDASSVFFAVKHANVHLLSVSLTLDRQHHTVELCRDTNRFFAKLLFYAL